MNQQGVLLLGGTGFVGRTLAARLVVEGKQVFVIARREYDWSKTPSVVSYTSSLDNRALLEEVLPRCKTVFHLATETTPGASALHPAIEAEANLLPTLRFLECLQKYPDILLVYISSGGAAYGDNTHCPVSEQVALSPISYYGAGKAALEKFILAFCRQTQGRAIILRPSNFYGPGQPYQKGFGVIPTIFHHLLTGNSMQIYGDGETVRDYFYIEDFIDFCTQNLVINNCCTRSKVYNIGSGRGTTLNELCNMAEDISGKMLKRDYLTIRMVDVKNIVLDCTRIQSDYQWNAGTGLRTGVTRAWEWFCTQKSM